MNRVTLLGEYSSGKTALLNALLEDKFFVESITKETALATNVFYTTEDNYYTTQNEYGDKSAKCSFVTPFDTKCLGNDVEANVFLNNPAMCDFFKKDIYFTDLPGTNSGDELHEKIIIQSAIKSDLILVCVPANKGTISNSLLETVKKLHSLNKGAFFVGLTTKSDMPDIEDKGVSHCKLLKEELLKGIPKQRLLGCVTTDAKTKKITELRGLLLFSSELINIMLVVNLATAGYSFFKKLIK